MNSVLRRLGSLDVTRFMRQYWQRKPLLVRNALPALAPPLDRAALFALAQRADVESRLVSAFDGRWQLRQGPLPARALPSPRKPGWTLLVQGVDLYVEAAAQLLARFRFVPDARLDDLMVSYASDGGGVGPHVDSYDVFLVQATGRRRWRIGRPRRLDIVPDLPLRILADFRPTDEWVLDPGDLLYLPPGVAHEGAAVGDECMTCSIGFRAPAVRELLDPWLDALAVRVRVPGAYRDPGVAPVRRPAQLPAPMIAHAHAALGRVRPLPADTVQALLTVLTEPKPQVVFSARRPVSARAFLQRAARSGVRLDRRTRLLYDGRWFGANGEVFAAAATERTALARLADQRRLAGDALQTSASLAARLRQWYHAGWLGFDSPSR